MPTKKALGREQVLELHKKGWGTQTIAKSVQYYSPKRVRKVLRKEGLQPHSHNLKPRELRRIKEEKEST